MIHIQFFKGLPIEHSDFHVEKYDSLYTTCEYIKIYFTVDENNYMLVKKNDLLIDLLIFGNMGNLSICLNSLVSIDKEIISLCTQKLFDEYRTIKKVKISASYNNYIFRKSFLLSTSNNYILKLPSTFDQYFLELGHSTRKNIRNQKSKLLRDFPNIKFYTLYGKEINSVIIEKIIQLNTDRMKYKGIIAGKSNSENTNTYLFSKSYGCVTYIEINGEIVAGNIAYILNKNIYGHVIAHDDDYSNYSLGTICQIQTIQAAIAKGLTDFHFLWGENDYKIRLLAKPHQLFSLYIYSEYSLDYIYNKLHTLFYRQLISLRLSKHTLVLRNAIKSYRKKRWKS